MHKVSHIFNYQLADDKAIHSNTLDEVVTYDSFAEFVISTTVYNTCVATFKDNIRRKENFIQSNLIVFDYDYEECTLEELEDWLSEYNYAVCTTRNHQKWKKDEPPCNRYRLLIPLSEPVLNTASYSATYDKLATLLVPAKDPCMRNGVQYMRAHREYMAGQDDKDNFKPVHVEQPKEVKISYSDTPDLDKFFFDIILDNEDMAGWADDIGTPGKSYEAILNLGYACKLGGVSQEFFTQYVLSKFTYDRRLSKFTTDWIGRIYKPRGK